MNLEGHLSFQCINFASKPTHREERWKMGFARTLILYVILHFIHGANMFLCSFKNNNGLLTTKFKCLFGVQFGVHICIFKCEIFYRLKCQNGIWLIMTIFLSYRPSPFSQFLFFLASRGWEVCWGCWRNLGGWDQLNCWGAHQRRAWGVGGGHWQLAYIIFLVSNLSYFLSP